MPRSLRLLRLLKKPFSEIPLHFFNFLIVKAGKECDALLIALCPLGSQHVLVAQCFDGPLPLDGSVLGKARTDEIDFV